MKKVFNYLVWKVLYPLITFCVIAYGIIGINNGWQYSVGIWRIARVFMWFSFSACCILLPLILIIQSKKEIKEKYIELKNKRELKLPSYVGIITHIGEMALIAWFGNITYSIVWIFVFCVARLSSLLLQEEKKKTT